MVLKRFRTGVERKSFKVELIRRRILSNGDCKLQQSDSLVERHVLRLAIG